MKNQQNSNSVNSLLTLEELFSGRYFLVPDYQRGYSWEKEQLNDIRKDIENLYDREHKHYTGTLVATPNPDIENTYEIVDGQQRLTTLIILLKTIIDINPSVYSHLEKKFIERGEKGNRLQVLRLNEETNDFFYEVIIKKVNKNSEIKSHECINNAKLFFSEWIESDLMNINRIVNIVTNQLGFLLFTPENDKEIGIMFEVINNRGKNLSQLEKIKNYFIYFATVYAKQSLRISINRKWIEIQKNLSHAEKTSNEEEDRFLRYCYLVFFDTNKEKSWWVYEQLKQKFNVYNKDIHFIDASIDEIEKFINFLVNASLHYAYLYNSKGFFNNNYTGGCNKEIKDILRLLRCQHTNASILPLYLAIMSRLSTNPDEKRIHNLLVLLEKVNFRIYILPKITHRADSKQGDMFWFANYFYHNPEWNSADTKCENRYTNYNGKEIIGDIFDWVEEQLIQITMKYCTELKFIQSLTIDNDEAENYFHWNGMRYFLANYEIHLRKQSKQSWDIENILKTRKDVRKETNDYLSREHIWAQGDRLNDFPADYIEKRRLGNFVLLGLSINSKLSDKPIPEKIAELAGINSSNNRWLSLYQVQELTSIFSLVENDNRVKYRKGKNRYKNKNYFSDLSRCLNDNRETRMIIFALERWKLPGESFNKFVKVDSFHEPKTNEIYILKNK